MSLALLLAILLAGPPVVPVTVTGKCPSAEAVTAALASALGSEVASPAREPPRVTDLGDRFSVAAAGQSQQYADPGRDCEERARAAAVFIALALNPPLVPLPPAPAAPLPVVATPASPPPPPSPRWFDVGVAARLDGGPSADAGAAIGAELRVAAGWRRLGLEATAALLAPTDGTFSSITVRQQRFPLGLALTARHQLSPRFTIAGALGAALVPITLRADGLTGAASSARLQAGARLAVALKLRATPHLAPFVDLHAEIFPRAYQLDVDPTGNVGATGRLWLGVTGGLSFEILPAQP